jgi:hypothetical protein
MYVAVTGANAPINGLRKSHSSGDLSDSEMRPHPSSPRSATISGPTQSLPVTTEIESPVLSPGTPVTQKKQSKSKFLKTWKIHTEESEDEHESSRSSRPSPIASSGKFKFQRYAHDVCLSVLFYPHI